MIVSDSTTLSKLNGFLDTIKRKPKKDVKHFFFDESTKFIVDGKKLRMLPMAYSFLSSKDEFYIYVDLAERTIKYFAFDIKGFASRERKNTVYGEIRWEKEIEDSIHNFFVLNIKELTEETYPYSNTSGLGRQPDKPKWHGHSDNCICQICKPYKPPTSGSYTGASHSYSFDNNAYKERESFYDKIWALQKDGKTSQAIDHINESIVDMCKREKLSIIDDILRLIAFDKLEIPAMLNIASATQNINGLKERTYFLNKVKDHVMKIKPSRAGLLLKGLSFDNPKLN